MEIFSCFVSKHDYIMAKDKVACIHNYLRKKNLDIADKYIKTKIRNEIQKRYKSAKGKKTFLEIADEYYKDLKKEDN